MSNTYDTKRSQISFQFPGLDSPGVANLEALVKEAAEVLRTDRHVTGPYTVTVIVSGQSDCN